MYLIMIINCGANLGLPFLGKTMYICNCTAVRDSDVRAAIDRGAMSVTQVFETLGEKQSCGKCTPEVRKMLGQNYCYSTDLRASNTG